MSLTVFTPTFGTSTYYFPVTADTESDTPFLQYRADTDVAFGIGGLSAALFLAFLATVGLSRTASLAGGVVASMSLMISLFLRASLNDTHQVPMYVASLVLDSVAAYLLLSTGMFMCSKWIRDMDGPTPFAGLVVGVGALALVACVVIEAVAVPLSFYADPWYRHIGHILHTTSVSITVAVAAIGLLVTTWKAATTQSHTDIIVPVVSLVSAFAALCVWSSFALAQTKLPLTFTVNRSETMWYLLNVLPLGLVLVVWTVLNAPRAFNFDQYTAQRKHHLPPPPHYRPRHSRSYGGHYEYPEQDYSYPLRAPGVPDFCRQSTVETSDAYKSGMTEEDKIQRAMLRYV
ncbi:hypothetical protein GGI20_002035 [Coemansia sp. BCRC 34301]|nr:hypothetical protein GGI20_002035 [Coemansia sp. BCRC 34301]